MKYSKLSLFSAIFIFFNTYSHAITLDQSAIDKKALEIEKKLTQDRYLMYGLTTFAVTYGIYQWMPLLINIASNKSIPAPTKDTSPAIEEQKPAEKRPLSRIFKDGIKSFTSGTYDLFHDLFCTKESWMSMFQFTLSISGANIIAQISERFIHPDTLRWYIHAYAPYHLTIKMMKEKIKDLQDADVDQEQHCVSNKMLPLLYNRLVRQAILICAYITYKVKHLDDAEKVIGERAKISMLKTHTKWLNDIEEQLNASECDFAVIEDLLDAYGEALVTQVNHFALIEGETRKEKTVIKRQMEQKLSAV